MQLSIDPLLKKHHVFYLVNVDDFTIVIHNQNMLCSAHMQHVCIPIFFWKGVFNVPLTYVRIYIHEINQTPSQKDNEYTKFLAG